MQQRRERRERLGLLAQEVIAAACKDAMPNSKASDEERIAARKFIFTDAAQIWADAARFDLPLIRKELKKIAEESESTDSSSSAEVSGRGR